MNKDISIPFHLINLHLFTAVLRIGRPVVEKSLQFDTASGLPWIQCEPCIHCFRESSDVFDPRNSTSFRYMRQHQYLDNWFDCTSGTCLYSQEYMGRSKTSGYVGTEIIQLGRYSYDMDFNCGTHNIGWKFENELSGILGMNGSPITMLSQLEHYTSNRFSYCIPNNHEATSYSYVRFGHEAIIRSTNVQTTQFIPVAHNAHYMLKLNGLSVAGKLLGLRQRDFSDGCVIDTGASYTYIKQGVFDIVIEEFERYFAQFGSILERFHDPYRILCYTSIRNQHFASYPSMIFHFKGAKFEVQPQNLFRLLDDHFCLEIMVSPSMTVLGVYQQMNTRFVYDMGHQTLSFAPEDCSNDVD